MMIKLPNIVKAVGIVTLITAIGKILGFLRESIIAAYFGTSREADVFFVASLLPTILFTALGTAIQAGLIPIYVKEKEKSIKRAGNTISVLGTIFILISVALSLLAFLFAKPIVTIIAPGFSSAELVLAEHLTKIMVPSIIFFTLTSVAIGVLNANKKFVLPAFTATVQNIVVILATILFAHSLGVVGLAYGMLLGAIFQFVIQWPSLVKYHVHFRLDYNKKQSEIIKTLFSFYPIIIASVAVQINGLTDRMISSLLDEGSISSLNYAYRLLWLPLSVVLGPVITVLYPSIVESTIKGFETFIQLVLKGLKSIIYLSLPFMIVMIISGKALIQLAFERGAFDLEATNRTYVVFVYYVIGLAFFALRDYLMNCFYALKDNKRVMYSCVLSVLLNILLSLTLSQFLQAAGIALAQSLACVFQTIYLLFFLNKANGKAYFNKGHVKDLGKYGLLFFLIIIVFIPFQAKIEQLGNILELLLTSFLVFFSYFILSWLLKVDELRLLLQMIKKKKGLDH